MQQLEIFSNSFELQFNKHYGWLPVTRFIKLGYDNILKDKTYFNNKLNSFKYGLSQPQFKAIRYWLLAFKIATEYNGELYATKFGETLFKYDSYLENPASAILLHYYLMKPTSIATSWYLTFNDFNQIEFSSHSLVELIQDNFQSKVAVSTIIQDIKCIIKMYLPIEKSKFDEYDSIFRQLNLIWKIEDKYRFNLNHKIFSQYYYAIAYTVIDWMQNNNKFRISDASYQNSSPGRCFKLHNYELERILELGQGNGYILSLNADFQPIVKITDDNVLDKLVQLAFTN